MPSRVGEFDVTIRPIRLTGVTHGEAVKLRFDFDHFKKWKSTTAVAAPTAHWNMERDEVKFVYKTEHMAELNQKLCVRGGCICGAAWLLERGRLTPLALAAGSPSKSMATPRSACARSTC